jgi:F-type H+-transporting ATPase subunit b
MTTGGESWLSWVFKFINFAVLIFVLVKYAGKPLKEYLVNRHHKAKEKVEEAEKLYSEAGNLKNEYEARLAHLDEEINAFKAKVMEETEKEKEKLLEEARSFAAKIQEQARLNYEQEMKEVKGRIREEIARLALEKAEKIVIEKLSRNDSDRMVEEFIEKLRSLN